MESFLLALFLSTMFLTAVIIFAMFHISNSYLEKSEVQFETFLECLDEAIAEDVVVLPDEVYASNQGQESILLRLEEEAMIFMEVTKNVDGILDGMLIRVEDSQVFLTPEEIQTLIEELSAIYKRFKT